MATCPVCQSNIEITAQHHGTLYTCPKCSAVFFVGWDGQPEVADANEPAPFEPAPENNQNYSVNGYEQNPNEYQSNEYQPNEFQQSESVQGDSQPVESEQYEYQSNEVAPVDFAPGEVAATETVDSEPYDFAGPPGFSLDNHQANSSEVSSESRPSDNQNPFAEINEFGNSDTSQAAFSYTVTISGVDSAAVRASLLEALSDKKFGWEPGPLLSQMKDGVLTIRSVSAVKASILIQRIKYLPVHVSWRQDVLSSSV